MNDDENNNTEFNDENNNTEFNGDGNNRTKMIVGVVIACIVLIGGLLWFIISTLNNLL